MVYCDRDDDFSNDRLPNLVNVLQGLKNKEDSLYRLKPDDIKVAKKVISEHLFKISTKGESSYLWKDPEREDEFILKIPIGTVAQVHRSENFDCPEIRTWLLEADYRYVTFSIENKNMVSLSINLKK
jgi:hypothetical protein